MLKIQSHKLALCHGMTVSPWPQVQFECKKMFIEKVALELSYYSRKQSISDKIQSSYELALLWQQGITKQ